MTKAKVKNTTTRTKPIKSPWKIKLFGGMVLFIILFSASAGYVGGVLRTQMVICGDMLYYYGGDVEAVKICSCEEF